MSLKIYFAGSIRGGRQDVELYHSIIAMLKPFGKILTEFVGDKEISFEYNGVSVDKSIHDHDMEMLKECHCVIAETTQPSLGVGYELGRAVAMNKPILCLFRPKSDKVLSAMIRGAHNGSSFIVIDYEKISEVKDNINTFLENVQQQVSKT
ncbi:LOW QUALITY PROTEIN: 2'-deoxynucleoside 5'-phosphate N-hydrolase 1-like [Physella acuta]|uniref:LOW QUALITY PROTEIN: 2'-deoxynucleoside 5'-phosphate N-hydrolase 1-like n=1 Tax=Physella acuta TaxID=109671 RepID=UPI0027DE5D52|nr:LOW QUALITY PROTEIN: 2'-deoxynucleoside 5'-phosphate N-hydrolase 1-like [Physella acuta]